MCGIINVPFGLTYHFSDLHHIHENNVETLDPYYSNVYLYKIINLGSFTSHFNIILWCKDKLMLIVMCLELLDN